MEIKIGDTVVVRGLVAPEMVVETIVSASASDATGMPFGVHCMWFDSTERLQRDIFDERMLLVMRDDRGAVARSPE